LSNEILLSDSVSVSELFAVLFTNRCCWCTPWCQILKSRVNDGNYAAIAMDSLPAVLVTRRCVKCYIIVKKTYQSA